MQVHYIVHGIVQGVGYRAFVAKTAGKYGIRGFVKNLSDGSVEILAIGEPKDLDAFEMEIKAYDLNGAEVMNVEKEIQKEERNIAGFRIEY